MNIPHTGGVFAAVLSLSLPVFATNFVVCREGPPNCNFTSVQDAIDAASLGDTIALQAGETFDGFILRYKPGGAGNPIVITTTAAANLPAPGTRITPAYSAGAAPVTARIQGSDVGYAVATENGTDACPGAAASCPAHDYVLQGLEIVPAGFAYNAVRIGPQQDSDHVTTADGFPYNITLDRVYIHQDPLHEVRRCVTPHGANIVIENSWIAGCKMRGVDSQAIEDWSGPGPLSIFNNYLEASTEVVSFGGAMPTMQGLIPQSIEIAYNQISRPDYYLNGRTAGLNGVWSGGAFYGQGKFILPSADNGFQYWAQNSGASGATEPAWPTTEGATVQDGDIVWKAEPLGNRWLVKNLLESKSSDGLYVHDNVFENNPAASQEYAVVLTVRTGQSGSWARVWHTSFLHNVVRNANAVLGTLGRDNEDGNLNQVWEPGQPYSQGARVVPVFANGLVYTAQNDGVSGSVRPAWATHPGATVTDGGITWKAAPLPAKAWTWSPNNLAGTVKILDIRNNLFEHIGKGYGYGPDDDTAPVFSINNGITFLNIDHNTIDSQNALLLEGGGYPGNGTFTNNLATKGAYGVFTSTASGDSVQGCAAIQYTLCNDPRSPGYPSKAPACGPDVFAANVISGYTVSAEQSCTQSDQIPAGNWGTSWDQIGFDVAAAGLQLTAGSPFATAGTDGQPLGADPAALPLIRDLNVAATANQATFTYTAPNGIACVLQVSTSRDFNPVVPDVDPTLFPQADSDQFRGPSNGNSRTFVVGTTSPDRSLAPNTTYWYWLSCGGDARTGTFTTAAQ